MKIRTRATMAVAGMVTAMISTAGIANAAPMILNEYNAVKIANYLGGGDSTLTTPADPYFGRVAGNGGDWMEFVVIQDMLDVRGWSFVTTQAGVADATITLPSLDVFGSLRSGTIITIAEDVASDFSYNPVYDAGNANAGDWWINYQASFSVENSSVATNDNFQVTIKDASGNAVFGPAGEGIKPTKGVGSTDVFKLEADPSSLVTPTSAYNNGTSSTFGAANKWSSGTITQNFSGLRSVAAVPEPSSILAIVCGLGSLATIRKRRK